MLRLPGVVERYQLRTRTGLCNGRGGIRAKRILFSNPNTEFSPRLAWIDCRAAACCRSLTRLFTPLLRRSRCREEKDECDERGRITSASLATRPTSYKIVRMPQTLRLPKQKETRSASRFYDVAAREDK